MISSAASKAMRVAKAAAFYAVVLGVLAALVLVAGTKAEAAFPGKNGKIAFTSWRDGNPEIYAMNQYGPNPQNLTLSTGIEASPEWSPNGKHIAFTSYRDGNYEIYRMGADGGSPLRLTYVSDNLSPSWQPLPQGSLQQ